MAGPWEDFRKQDASDGPWNEYDRRGKPEKSLLQKVAGAYGDYTAGAVRGAGSIGSTLLWPIDKATDLIKGDREGLPSRNEQRRQDIDAGLQSMGADPESLPYQGGRLVGEIAGTAGAPGVIAKGATVIPALSKFAPAIQSGGFNLGTAATANPLANALMRGGAGGVAGGTQAGMVSPDSAGIGALIGGVAPGAVSAAGAAGNAISSGGSKMAESLMMSALKPTIKQHQTGQAKVAARTLLDEGLNATQGGVEALKGRVSGLNDEISDLIANSGSTVSKQDVIKALLDTKTKFGNQVAPAGDLAAIQGVEDAFLSHPTALGNDIPVQLAQELKKGTYKVLSKKYGQLGSAETEAQKALARGLKEGIAKEVPEVAGLNAMESKLLDTLKVTERRALMDMNKNPGGLALLASNPASFAAFVADKSALFKSLAARAVESASKGVNQKLLPDFTKQYGLLGAPSVAATSP